MRFSLKLVLVCLSLWTTLASPIAKGQVNDEAANAVLVSAEQGEALAEFAQRSIRHIRPKPDCSHLVHLLYARAGLIYPYEDSRVLYRGISDFERVKTPQPGDLAVWLGHVGIVLLPEENTFLSSVRSGILTESWKAPHWVRRGRPRFYRYRIGPAADMNLLATLMFDETRAAADTHSARSNSTSMQHPFPDRPPALGRVDDDGPQTGRVESSPPDSLRGLPEHEFSSSGSIVATIDQRQTPNKRQISAAFLESSNARARRFIGSESLDLANPFSVFERVEVEKINIKHESGWITLRVSETLCQEAGKVLPGKTTERVLSIVRRNGGMWVISDPQDRTYLAEENALQIFERQAELFLRLVPNSSNTRAIVKALDLLYDKQAPSLQRAAR
ncbi:MAG: hypothetical protein JWM83_2866 [Candidatus Angelobacter sp.]|jgi:hypothetical protein|nr:hypothetical protein [Candidatus Angelobacter sp.]